MPTLAEFLRLSPFSLPELVDAVNAVLRARPALLIRERTVRFYISKRVIPGPFGSPKLARYEVEHLVRIVALRLLQDQGIPLDEASSRLNRMFEMGLDRVVEQIDRMLLEQPSGRGLLEDYETEEPRGLFEKKMYSMAYPSERRRDSLFEEPKSPFRPQEVTRYRIVPGVVLEVQNGISLGKWGRKIVDAVNQIILTHDNT